MNPDYKERLKYKLGNVLEEYEIYTTEQYSPESAEDFELVAESDELDRIVDDLFDVFSTWMQDKLNEEDD